MFHLPPSGLLEPVFYSSHFVLFSLLSCCYVLMYIWLHIRVDCSKYKMLACLCFLFGRTGAEGVSLPVCALDA